MPCAPGEAAVAMFIKYNDTNDIQKDVVSGGPDGCCLLAVKETR
jgi:hypothetical protein